MDTWKGRAEELSAQNYSLRAEVESWKLMAHRVNEERDKLLLQIDDLKDSLGHREAQLNEALAKVQESNRLNGELRESLAEVVNALRMRDHENRYTEEIEDAQRLLTERPVREVMEQERAALLDPKSPGWDKGAENIMSDLRKRRGESEATEKRVEGA